MKFGFIKNVFRFVVDYACAELLDDGSLKVLDQVYSSPSYAALAGIQDAGSERKTVNGWISWKTETGETIAELRERFLRDS